MVIQLLHGDCLELMRGMADNSVDVVVTDPPYDETTHSGERSLWSSTGTVKQSISFTSVDSDWIKHFISECVRVSSGWVVATVDWRHMNAIESTGFLVRFGIWVKPKYTPQITGDRPATGWEAIAICHRPSKKQWNGGGKSAVWSSLPVPKKNHPTEKPLELAARFINLFSNTEATVFDPCMGSGTTGVACVQTGRSFIGIEIDPNYYAIAQRRIAEAQMQPALFTEAA